MYSPITWPGRDLLQSINWAQSYGLGRTILGCVLQMAYRVSETNIKYIISLIKKLRRKILQPVNETAIFFIFSFAISCSVYLCYLVCIFFLEDCIFSRLDISWFLMQRPDCIPHIVRWLPLRVVHLDHLVYLCIMWSVVHREYSRYYCTYCIHNHLCKKKLINFYHSVNSKPQFL